jgi:hypothetical protein
MVPSAVPGLVRFCSSVTVDSAVAPASPKLLTTGITFASPKSKSLACPRLVMKILAGFMSRWMMPAPWEASRAVGDVDAERQ